MMAQNCASQCILMKDPTTEGLESLRKWFDRFSMRRTMENKAAVPMDIDENADSEPDDPPNAPEVASAANQQSEPEVVYANLKEYQASLTLNAFRFHYDVNIFPLFFPKEISNFKLVAVPDAFYASSFEDYKQLWAFCDLFDAWIQAGKESFKVINMSDRRHWTRIFDLPHEWTLGTYGDVAITRLDLELLVQYAAKDQGLTNAFAALERAAVIS